MTEKTEPPGSAGPRSDARRRGETIECRFGNVERNGPWTVPAELDVHVRFGNAQLDLREAILEADVTTIRVNVKFGNLELLVPPELAVEVNVDTVGANVTGRGLATREPVEHGDGVYRRGEQPQPKLVRVIGRAKLGNCEIIPLARGATNTRHARHLEAHRHRHERWRELHAEREMWLGDKHRARWLPWWLQARMRRRIFIWLVLVFAAGIAAGVYAWDHARWWYAVPAALALSAVSGMVSWRLTHPLLAVVRAARAIGDGKLDTRLPRRGGGEMRILSAAINDMASRIEQQLKDQKQLLAAVSHELRTPLGHMRVLIETARDHQDPKALAELDREVMVLDDLVGKLLASSRLEFGNLELRDVDLGELVTDIATSAGIAPDAIEATGDLHAKIDPTLVRRAIANLVDNARVHGNGAVAVRAYVRGAQIAIEVDDAGPGVAADRRADAFRAFVPSSGGGLGLGLALVSRIAVAHGGGAWIADRPGGGARVGFAVATAAPPA
ncbi:MAG TPA: ATP-binding protein [Kofleriaceae bacterium]|jgi:signal transduction histidine kinase